MEYIKGKFKNCISLGWFCGTAGSMAKLGIRASSGPFDWFFSDLEPVLYLIENEFVDFMVRDNLVPSESKPKQFYDVKYGFHFFHDIKNNLDDDYDEIFRKYMRRKTRFLEEIKQPTLFLRSIRSTDEKDYIISHVDGIERIIKQKNKNNTIVFLTTDKIGKLPKGINSYELNIADYAFDAASTRNMFDSSFELLTFLGNAFDVETVENNKAFDENSNYACAANIYSLIKANDDVVLQGIRDVFNLEAGEGLFLWGMGYQGKAMLSFLINNGVRVNGLIDSNLYGEQLNGYKIETEDIIPDNAKVLLSIADRAAVDKIKVKLETRCAFVCDYQQLFRRIKRIIQ